MPMTVAAHKLSDGSWLNVYGHKRKENPYNMYHENACGTARRWLGVDELTMRCIVEELKKNPRAGMEDQQREE
jgi:hypothetical protein